MLSALRETKIILTPFQSSFLILFLCFLSAEYRMKMHQFLDMFKTCEVLKQIAFKRQLDKLMNDLSGIFKHFQLLSLKFIQSNFVAARIETV
jgi:hypothetical protein